MTRTYQPIAARWTGTLENLSTVYTQLARPQDTRGNAISEGFAAYGSDDFNIAVIEDGRLVSWDWMDEVVETDPSEVRRIAAEVGLR
jgi:hypothetical protein